MVDISTEITYRNTYYLRFSRYYKQFKWLRGESGWTPHSAYSTSAVNSVRRTASAPEISLMIPEVFIRVSPWRRTCTVFNTLPGKKKRPNENILNFIYCFQKVHKYVCMRMVHVYCIHYIRMCPFHGRARPPHTQKT